MSLSRLTSEYVEGPKTQEEWEQTMADRDAKISSFEVYSVFRK